MKTTITAVLAAVAIVLLSVSSMLEACSVPVFRYALERWQAAPYEVIVLHRGALDADAKKLVDWLNACADTFEGRTNMEVFTVDLDAKVDPRYADVVKAVGDAPLPQLVLRYPEMYGRTRPIWSGVLAPANQPLA